MLQTRKMIIAVDEEVIDDRYWDAESSLHLGLVMTHKPYNKNFDQYLEVLLRLLLIYFFTANLFGKMFYNILRHFDLCMQNCISTSFLFCQNDQRKIFYIYSLRVNEYENLNSTSRCVDYYKSQRFH